MARSLTFADVLLYLPVDDVLLNYLAREGLVLAEPPPEDAVQHSRRLIDQIRQCPDGSVRERIIAGLNACTQLAHPAGKQAMFQACGQRSEVLLGLIACKDDLHRAFWLYARHPELYEQACELEHLERHAAQAQQHELGVQAVPRQGDEAVRAFQEEIARFYQREIGCGDGCVAYLLERAPGVFLATVHVKDLATLRLEFEGQQLRRRVGNPNIHMVLEYAQATGVVRTLVRGGAKYHQMLVQAFARHLLGSETQAQRLRPPTLDLSALRTGFDVPQAIVDGFVAVQVKSITVMSPETALRLECTATISASQRCVTQLLAEHLPTDNPLRRHWTIAAAQVNLYYPPASGRGRMRVVSVEVTRRGRLNLHKFDAALQAQLEGYLVSIGVLQRGQTLLAHEVPSRAEADLRAA